MHLFYNNSLNSQSEVTGNVMQKNKTRTKTLLIPLADLRILVLLLIGLAVPVVAPTKVSQAKPNHTQFTFTKRGSSLPLPNVSGVDSHNMHWDMMYYMEDPSKTADLSTVDVDNFIAATTTTLVDAAAGVYFTKWGFSLRTETIYPALVCKISPTLWN